jgi:hypothetical protein
MGVEGKDRDFSLALAGRQTYFGWGKQGPGTHFLTGGGVLADLKLDSAPGQDGLPVVFFKRF